MSISNVTSTQTTNYTAYTNTTKANNTKNTETAASTSNATEAAAVYEPSKETETSTTKNNYANPELVAKLKADVERQTSQLRSLVEKLMMGQSTSYANATDMWQFLKEGNFEVDAETKAQAQADIAEDGYWGVEKTSDRILDFAKALAGDDPEKLEKMKDAFEKGYKQAKKTWGGELPEISQKTRDAVLKKFDELIHPETKIVE